MEMGNDNIITKEEYKNLNTENISRIILKNGKVLKFNSNNDNNNLISLNACTCNNKKIIERNFNNINKNKGFYVTTIPNAKTKLLAIKVPYYQEQKEIKYIKTFTFESSTKKYKYKPYKTPKRKHGSRIKYNNGYKYINNINNNINQYQYNCNNQRNNKSKNKQCICMQYCTCRKSKEY